MSSRVHILGGSQTDFKRNWSKEEKGISDMLKEVLDEGLNFAGLPVDEISRLNKDARVAAFVGNFSSELFINQAHLGAFFSEAGPAFYGVPGARYEAACASGSVALDAAATKIRAGELELAIVADQRAMPECLARGRKSHKIARLKEHIHCLAVGDGCRRGAADIGRVFSLRRGV